ncbi:activating signal cointegrator 1 complex subunit 3-like isoform 2-T2 [Glossina fuscipes fuscipes]
MATMNRPTFQTIRSYPATGPSIVFVSSRRQTRLTAFDLITWRYWIIYAYACAPLSL